jgi:hypothetical protein
MYIKIAAIAIIGVLSYLLIISKAKQGAVLEEKKRNLEARKRVYERADANTAREEERLVRKIEELDERLRADRPPPPSNSSAASRLRDLMGWGRGSPD